MRLVEKLVRRLHRIFSRDPDRFLAFRFQYDGDMSWEIRDCVLTTVVDEGGVGDPLLVDLSDYTLSELVDHIGSQPGYSIVTQPRAEHADLSARVLLDAGADQSSSNGDQVYGFEAIEWAYQDAMAVELQAAADQIENSLQQLSIQTAGDTWVDYIGDIYGFPRRLNESDALYGQRMLFEILAPRNNNKAIEMAISNATGGQPASVVNAMEPGDLFPVHDGQITYDGTQTYSTTGKPVRNLFDVEYAFDLLGSEDIAPFQERVLGLIDEFRAAGNHLRQILLNSGQISDTVELTTSEITSTTAHPALEDTVPGQTESNNDFTSSMPTMTDSAVAPSEGDGELSLLSNHQYDGTHQYGGSPRQLFYNSTSPWVESL